MTLDESLTQLANATGLTLDEASKALSRAYNSFKLNDKDSSRFNELMSCPWWKFWNGWFTKY